MTDENAPGKAHVHLPFGQHHAFIIGIDAYENVSTLQTAVADARRVAEVLGEQQHFKVHQPLLDARGSEIRTLFQTMSEQVGKDDRVFFYFAGHGIAADGEDGPAGYIVPVDAEPSDLKTLIPMADLQTALDGLSCRHLLLVLDCCFSGAFKWSSQYRAIRTLLPKKIYKERFDRFIHDPAWQVITSAAYDQKALDVLDGRATGDRGSTKSTDDRRHSPFALALFEALAGSADVKGERESDGVITATELYAYIRDQVEPESIEAGQRKRQTPGFFPLRKHDKGEYIFLHPRHRLNLPPIPSHSPYKGLESFDEDDQLLFYGRDDAIRELRAKTVHNRLVVVSGASGTGKSSVIKAGLLPVLRTEGFRILPVMRPGRHPLAKLEKMLEEANTKPADVATQPGGQGWILLIDQFEEVITRCTDPNEREQFDARLKQLLEDDRIHRIILTVRADFEPQLNSGALENDWVNGRYTVPPFSLEDLKEIIVLPTLQEVLIFDPPELVDEIISEVVQSPGAMPLLSYTLSELYEAYRTSGREDRALKKEDYDKLGGVMGALRTRAENLYASLQPAQQSTMRKIMLRMVSVEGDLAGKRVPVAELDYSTEENPRVEEVVAKLVETRLVVKGLDYIEPAHDALVRAWKTLHDWIHVTGRDKLLLSERLGPEAEEFARTGNSALLWHKKPQLALAALEMNNSEHSFNARELVFIRKSVARNKRKARIIRVVTLATMVVLLGLVFWALENAREAEEEKQRAVQGLFSALRLNMKSGQPGSLCLHGLCNEAPQGDGDETAWLSVGRMPEDLKSDMGDPTSRVFTAVRQYGKGHVLVYAQDSLTHDREVKPGFEDLDFDIYDLQLAEREKLVIDNDNLQFAENALRWLMPTIEKAGCKVGTNILILDSLFVPFSSIEEMRELITKRKWNIETTDYKTLEKDLKCAGVLWYLSDWQPPADFVEQQVPLIEKFVKDGGGLLVGGLGWSYAAYGGPDLTSAPDNKPYPADQLGEEFGFKFTTDSFETDKDVPITLLSGAPSTPASTPTSSATGPATGPAIARAYIQAVTGGSGAKSAGDIDFERMGCSPETVWADDKCQAAVLDGKDGKTLFMETISPVLASGDWRQSNIYSLLPQADLQRVLSDPRYGDTRLLFENMSDPNNNWYSTFAGPGGAKDVLRQYMIANLGNDANDNDERGVETTDSGT
jgi:hypothetical protein